MTELNVIDVQQFTKGRLQASDLQVEQMLAAALSVCRRACGWHVSPVRTELLTLDGPGSRILWLPSRRVEEILRIEENGVDRPLSSVRWSRGGDRPVAVRKRSNGFWSGEYGSIEIEMRHGFPKDEAIDWRRAVLSMVDQMSLVPIKGGAGISEFGLRSKQVDDVVYRWDSFVNLAEDVLFSVEGVLRDYSLPSMEYL